MLAALVSLALCQAGDPLDAIEDTSMSSRMLRVIELQSDLDRQPEALPPRPVLLRRLLDPNQRDEAWANLNFGQTNRRENWDRGAALFQVNHVMTTPGRNGRPVYVVFSADLVEPDFRPGIARGHFEVLTEAPGFRPIFLNENVIKDSSRVFDFTGAGDLAAALVVTYSTPNGDVQVLDVVALAEPSKPLLSVVVGPPALGRRRRPVITGSALVECNGDGCATWGDGRTQCDPAYSWSWFLTPQGAGPPRIDLGPPASAEPAASYRWNPATRRFDGPRAITGQPFITLPLAAEAAVTRFAASTPAEGPAGDPSCN
ncbi:MAG: hypothetical protein QM723_37570 [Myxococcaceae bacterium]